MARWRQFARLSALTGAVLLSFVAVVTLPVGAASAATVAFHPIAPARIMDTRAGVGSAAGAPSATGGARAQRTRV